MNAKDFFGKLVSRYLMLHLLAMVLVVVALFVGVKYGLNAYTRHGQDVAMPNLYGMDYKDAMKLLEQNGLTIEANDTGYNKKMAADCILLQTPAAGANVKEGRKVYVTINSTRSPMVALPDLIDNSSYREAEAKLTAMGFRLLPPRRISGEQDWVYGIVSHGRQLSTGDQVSIEYPLTLILGNGKYDDEADDIEYIEPEYMLPGDGEDFDDFEEIPDGVNGRIDDSGINDF
jgi:beta-lactam-binding protein with PASTA domain